MNTIFAHTTANDKNKPIDNEYYTRERDVVGELERYDFSECTVYCPCDTDESEFVKYFKQEGKCKELIYTSDDYHNHKGLMFSADVVITNPPFSCWTDFYKMVKENTDNYIILAPLMNVKNLEVNTELLNRNLFVDRAVRRFRRPDGTLKEVLSCFLSSKGVQKYYVNREQV